MKSLPRKHCATAGASHSIEIDVGFMRGVGAYLVGNSPKASSSISERFRTVLHDGAISQRVQYMIEVLMEVNVLCSSIR